MSHQVKIKDRNFWEVVGTLTARPALQKTRTEKDVTEFKIVCQPNPVYPARVFLLGVFGDHAGTLDAGDRVRISGRLVMGDRYPMVCGDSVEILEKDYTCKNYQVMLPLDHAYRRRYR